jgi:hypothetical protein
MTGAATRQSLRCNAATMAHCARPTTSTGEPIAVGVVTRLPSSGYTVTTSEVLRGDGRTRTESNPKK